MRSPVPPSRGCWHLVPLLLMLTLGVGCGDPTSPEGPAAPQTARDVGSLRVSIATTGTDLDPNGYAVVVDSTSHAAGINGTITVGDLVAGHHTVSIEGIAANCVIPPGNWGGPVLVTPGAPAPVNFVVSCFTRSIPAAFASTELLFVRDGQIYRSRADGTGLVALGSGANPAWSPDGQRVAFVRDTSIYVMDADGANARLVVRSGLSPAWSPDGSRLAFESTDLSIRVVPVDGPAAVVAIASYGQQPTWSPDGSRIAYDVADEFDGVTAVYVMDSDGSNPRVLSDLRFLPGGGVAWSPDGKQIAIAGSDRIAVVNADGSGLRTLTSLGGFSPAWSPDGQSIAFTVWPAWPEQCRDCAPSVFYITADGTTTGLLVGNAAGTSWRN